MTEDWGGWHYIGSSMDDVKIMYPWSGVYEIRQLDASEKPTAIGRFLKVDKRGILMIGVSKRLGERICDFFQSYLEDARTHSEGRRLHLVRMMCTVKDEKYPDFLMQFRVKHIPDIEEARDEEERLLKDYFVEFGEVPPINATVGKKRVPWVPYKG